MKRNNGIDIIQVDGDSWVYWTAWAVQSHKKTPEELKTITKATIRYCLFKNIKSQLELVQKFLKIDKSKSISSWVNEYTREGRFKLYLTSTDKSNFRYNIATTQPYKANRKIEKPVAYEYLRNILIENWQAEVIHGMEADDMLSINAYKDPEHTLTIEIDKDGRQVPGWKFWYDPNKQYNRKPYYVDTKGILLLERSNTGVLELFATGLYQLGYQLLAGDDSDTIPPLEKGWGPRSAYKFLKELLPEHVMPYIKREYMQVHGIEQGIKRFEENYTLLKMLERNRDEKEDKFPK